MPRQEPNLSEDSRRKLNDVRREIWSGGLTGLFSGLCLGYGSSLLLLNLRSKIPSLEKINQKNYRVSAVLICGALGSFLGATVRGKNESYQLQEVYMENAKATGGYISHAQNKEKEILQEMEDRYRRRQEAIKVSLEKQQQGKGIPKH